jgi:glycosyltransferase involved in cell wall biosynthesis
MLNRVCMYTPSAFGGHARYSWELLNAIRDVCGNDCRCELVTSKNLEPHYRSDRYVVHPILPRLKHGTEFRSRIAWALSRVWHYVRREHRFLGWIKSQPDIAIVHLQECTPWLASMLVRRLRRSGKKVLYTVHNVRPHSYPKLLPRLAVDDWFRGAWRNCDALFVHTEQLRDELAGFLGKPHPPIHVVPHGIWSDTAATAPVPPLNERLRWKRILFFGAIRANKGLHLLLDQLQSLPEYSLTIAGDIADPEYFYDIVTPRVARLRSAGINIEVISRFVPDDQVPALFARHSVLALPYSTDFAAQSGVIFLALACRIAVVASTAGGFRELLERFRVGVTFDPTDFTSFRTALQELTEWSDEDFVTAVNRAKGEFSWRRAAEKTVTTYCEVSRAGTR